MTSPAETLVQIQNNLTELFLMMHSNTNYTNDFAPINKEAARVLDKKISLNEILRTTCQNLK